jgi:hypothetical protein
MILGVICLCVRGTPVMDAGPRGMQHEWTHR